MTKDEALKLALETAEGIVKSDWRKWQELASPDEFERWVKSRALHMATAIQEALEQPEQEPVANIRTWHKNGEQHAELWNWDKGIETLPDGNYDLYTTPPQRKPLTDVEIWNTYKNLWMFHPAEEPRLAGDVLKFARAIEQAHGIKE